MGFQQKWTKENIKLGLEKFFLEFDRYPTAEEIDSYQFLPSSRQIQRNFGGLVRLRQELGLKVSNYGAGLERSKIALEIGKRGDQLERSVEHELIQHFGEHFVHVEKLIGKGKRRVDFYIYANGVTFAVDVFYAKNMSQFKKIINLKALTYSGIGDNLLFVNLNELSDITDSAINDYIYKKRMVKLPDNIQVMNLNSFRQYFVKLQSLHVS